MVNPERVQVREWVKISPKKWFRNKFPQSVGSLIFIYISIFQLSELQESFQQIPHTYIQYIIYSMALANDLKYS